MTSALMVLVFAQVLGLSVRTFGFINLALVAVWIVLALAIVRENARLVASKSPT